MGVEVLGVGGEINGHGDTIDSFRQANETNARMLLNVAEGKNKNAPRPIYDPTHADNAWPVMVYHPAKGELTLGKTLKGLADPKDRQRVAKDNEAEYDEAIKAGYRDEPYAKPQIALLDPAAEKVELKRQNQEMQGQITALTDLVQKMIAGKPEPQKS